MQQKQGGDYGLVLFRCAVCTGGAQEAYGGRCDQTGTGTSSQEHGYASMLTF